MHPSTTSRLRSRLGARSTLKLGQIVAIAALGYACGNANLGRPAVATTQAQSAYLPFDQMSKVLVLVEHNYVEPAQREKLLDGAMRGMVAELDPHSSYMNAEEFAQFQSDTEGKFGGIGVEVDLRDELVTVIAPIEGSPAAKAGIRPGDRILAVEGKPLRGARIDKIVNLLRGEPGTPVKLSIGREGEEEPIEITVTREIVRVSSIEAKRLEGDVLYLRLKQFQETTHEEMLRDIGKVRSGGKPLRGVILDMRYNPGGLVDQSELVADEMLSSGTIYSTRHRGEVLDLVQATPGGALADLPIVTLVNEYTASAAELVAGALQDNDRTTVVGANSFGKGSVQTIFELPGGAGMRLTTMRYYTPAGRAIQAQGIEPDVLLRPAKETDVVRERDLEGHLAAEGRGPKRQQEVVTLPQPPEPFAPIRVADIPPDPTKGKDFALAEAFRRLQKKMLTKAQ
ncbi:MAG: S41 family peptidase [Polyangiaceae bacterium]|nr:S41 family peptidase [Polyangiaceae bacterium]